MQLGKIKIDFVPEFGNTSHIKVLDMAKSIQEKLAMLEKKKDAARGADALKKQIIKETKELKQYIAFLKSK